jgi:predicted PurR-regulated permease PerM
MLLLAFAGSILIFYFLLPIMDGVVLGTVFAYVGRPIRDLFGRRKRLGSVVATVSIVVPIFVILGLGLLELANFTVWLLQH